MSAPEFRPRPRPCSEFLSSTPRGKSNSVSGHRPSSYGLFQEATKVELRINLKTAKELGVEIPPTVPLTRSRPVDPFIEFY